MKRIVLSILSSFSFIFLLSFTASSADLHALTGRDSLLKEGDIIFQSDSAGQGKAIQIATHSEYSHCGILFKENGNWIVYEAVQPVKKTSLAEFISHGDHRAYAVVRLKDGYLDAAKISKMKSVASSFLNKSYDIYFDWSDDKLYCSEYVWKIYQRGAGIEVAKLRKFSSFDLNDPIVKLILQQRFGNAIPLDRTVISPADLYNSSLVKRVI
jgi:hypothetical protein